MASKDNDKSALIADYCNNRLNADQRADFERQLRDDQELLAEYEDFRRFQEIYRRTDPAEPSPSEAIFAQVSRNIAARQRAEKMAPEQAGRLSAAFRSFWRGIRESVAVPWVLAAAQAVVIVLLLAPAVVQHKYVTLSAAKVATIAGKIGINVVFRPTAPESDIRGLLLSIQGSISSGPSREGRYMISIVNPGDLDQAVRSLKQSEIVLFAEPVY